PRPGSGNRAAPGGRRRRPRGKRGTAGRYGPAPAPSPRRRPLPCHKTLCRPGWRSTGPGGGEPPKGGDASRTQSTHARDLVHRAKRPVPLPILEEAPGQARADPGERLQLLLGRLVEVDRPSKQKTGRTTRERGGSLSDAVRTKEKRKAPAGILLRLDREAPWVGAIRTGRPRPLGEGAEREDGGEDPDGGGADAFVHVRQPPTSAPFLPSARRPMSLCEERVDLVVRKSEKVENGIEAA